MSAGLRVRRQGAAWLSALALASGMPAVRAAAAPEPPCDLHYRITPRPDLQPAALEVELRFAAAGRRESVLRAVPAWAGVTDFASRYGDWQALGTGQSVAPLAEPYRWRVQHPPEGEVHLRWRVRTALPDPEAVVAQDQRQLYLTQVGPRGFQFFGHGVLASVEHWGDDTQPQLCLTLQPFDATSAVFGSMGQGAPGRPLVWRGRASPGLLRHGFHAGGPMWRLHERGVHGGPLGLAVRGRFEQLPDAAWVDAAARLIDMQRRFWEPTPGAAQPVQWLVLTPNHQSGGNSGGTLVHRVAVLHAPPGFSARSPTFESLVAHENLHQWFPRRFGGPGPGGPEQMAAQYWFSEGFTDHYTHRLLLASGLWRLEDYATRLTERAQRLLASPARTLTSAEIAPRFFSDREAGQQMYLRGEWLALRWDAALRRSGAGSLTALLQRLMRPEAEADALAAEPAAERVLAALAEALRGSGVDPRADVDAHLRRGQPLPLAGAAWADALAACFVRDEIERPVWALGFDTASFTARELRGVDPQGPAHAAGLRDGMVLVGWSVWGGDVERDVVLQVRDAATGPVAAGSGAASAAPADPGVREVVYRPVGRERLRLPRWQVRPGAEGDTACTVWRSAR